MDCERALELLYLVEDPCFDAAQREEFRRHLNLCGPCRRRAQVSSRVIRLVRERSLRAAAPPRLRIRILRSLAHRDGV